MSIDNSIKGFWWYFLRVVLFTLAFFTAILLLSDWNYGVHKNVGWAWDISNYEFWIGILVFVSIVFTFLAIITALIMKIAKIVK